MNRVPLRLLTEIVDKAFFFMANILQTPVS